MTVMDRAVELAQKLLMIEGKESLDTLQVDEDEYREVMKRTLDKCKRNFEENNPDLDETTSMAVEELIEYHFPPALMLQFILGVIHSSLTSGRISPPDAENELAYKNRCGEALIAAVQWSEDAVTEWMRTHDADDEPYDLISREFPTELVVNVVNQLVDDMPPEKFGGYSHTNVQVSLIRLFYIAFRTGRSVGMSDPVEE